MHRILSCLPQLCPRPLETSLCKAASLLKKCGCALVIVESSFVVVVMVLFLLQSTLPLPLRPIASPPLSAPICLSTLLPAGLLPSPEVKEQRELEAPPPHSGTKPSDWSLLPFHRLRAAAPPHCQSFPCQSVWIIVTAQASHTRSPLTAPYSHTHTTTHTRAHTPESKRDEAD